MASKIPCKKFGRLKSGSLARGVVVDCASRGHYCLSATRHLVPVVFTRSGVRTRSTSTSAGAKDL
jgi:hypothetical protein